MSAWLARAEAWLLEPAARPAAVEPPAPPATRLTVAVLGLSPGSGATTLARALAVQLARRDPAGAAIVMSEHRPSAPPAPATPAALRLARSLRALGCDGARAAGRLCLTGGPAVPPALAAPVVLDAGRAGQLGVGRADRTVVVAGPGAEPALAQVVRESFARGGREPDLVANRVEDAARWHSIGALVVGESRLAALWALAGHEPRGRLGAVVRELADAWERA